MDSLTQATLGAAIGEAVLGKKVGKYGAISGAVIATIPDLDVVFYLFYDSFDMLSIHRGYSHSFLFSVAGAFIAAGILQRWKKTAKVSYWRLWLFSWLALFTHLLLDAFTAYGTQLYLPFSDARVSFDSINVVDPVYTVPLLVGLLLSVVVFKDRENRPLFNRIGLIISTLYLLGTLIVKNQVENHFRTALENQKIEYQDLLTMPVGMASLNWYGVAKSEDELFMKKHNLTQSDQAPFHRFPIQDSLLNQVPTVAAEKMRWFAKGFYTVEKVEDKIRVYNLQVDMRGIVEEGEVKAPTKGYFEILPLSDGKFEFSSGAHPAED